MVEQEKLPPVRKALVYEVKGPVNAYITVSIDDSGNIREVFISVGKAGTTLNGMFQAFGRVISVSLRQSPELIHRIIKTLEGIETGEFYSCNGIRGKSLPDIVAKILRHTLENFCKPTECVNEDEDKIENVHKKGNQNKLNVTNPSIRGDLCPVCGKLALVRNGNCKTCYDCGFTTC
mgnify:CR=1 FL=1